MKTINFTLQPLLQAHSTPFIPLGLGHLSGRLPACLSGQQPQVIHPFHYPHSLFWTEKPLEDGRSVCSVHNQRSSKRCPLVFPLGVQTASSSGKGQGSSNGDQREPRGQLSRAIQRMPGTPSGTWLPPQYRGPLNTGARWLGSLFRQERLNSVSAPRPASPYTRPRVGRASAPPRGETGRQRMNEWGAGGLGERRTKIPAALATSKEGSGSGEGEKMGRGC